MTYTIAQNYWIFTFLQMMQIYSLSIRTLTLVRRATLTILPKKTSIGILSKLRYFLNTKTSLSLYYTLVEPFFNYCVIGWGNAYQSTLQPFHNLQNKAIRIITFSSFTEHSSPLFKDLNIAKLSDIITLQLSVLTFWVP